MLLACKTVKLDSPETATKLVEYSKSACFGECPSFKMLIKTDGSMEFEGRRHIDRIGKYNKQLDEDTYKKLYTALRDENMFQHDDAYNTDIQDGSKTKFIYYGESGKKQLETLFTFPGNTQEIATILETIAMNETGWEKIEEMEPKKNMEKDDEPIRKLMSYNQGACFGQCPSFSIDIFSDGRMLYVGKSFAKLMGIHEKQISDTDMNTILSLVQSEAFKTVNTRQDERIADAQTFKMVYQESETEKHVVNWKINNADVLEQIKMFFNKQAESNGWKQKTGKDSTMPTDNKNTLIISLDPSIKPKDWIKSQRHIDGKIVKFLSPNLTYFLMSFNPELSKDRVAEELRRNRYVLNVQTGNRVVDPRKESPTTGKSGKKGTATIKGNK